MPLCNMEVIVALSEQERRALEEIERALIAEDPRFAKRASRGGEETSFSLNIRSLALILLGLCFMVGGISLAQFSLWFVALSIVGFLIMFGGGLLAFQGESAPRDKGVGSAREAKRAEAKKVKSHGGLGDRMEDNFRRRFER